MAGILRGRSLERPFCFGEIVEFWLLIVDENLTIDRFRRTIKRLTISNFGRS